MKKLYILYAVSMFFWAYTAYAGMPSGIISIETDCASEPDSNVAKMALATSTISIYPNPVRSSATISFTYEALDKITILNIVGIEVKSIVPYRNTSEVHINLQELQPGVYFLSAWHNGSKLITKKFLKEE